MADDSMEISSEHGHNGGEEDIDIDFDFTSAHADEDYVLEDVAPDTEFGNTFNPHLSPDELMIDEDEGSYPMNDADVIYDEGSHITEHELMSFAQTDLDPSGAATVDSASATEGKQQNGSEPILHEEDGLDHGAIGTPADLEDHGEPEPQEHAILLEGENILDVEKVLNDKSGHDSRTVTPPNGSPHHSVGTEPIIPPTSSEHIHVETTAIPDISSPSAGQLSIPTKTEKEVIISSSHVTEPPNTRHDVIVVYRSVEYALFSTSELDDPDSFFLSDQSITEKPLADLFAAIRDVIHEDLSEEEELCISVEDIGLETEEKSTLVREITLGQILELYEKLLRNDGLENLRPLCILLGTRPNFSRRIGNLATAAAAGKGLSQMITWEEQSNSPDLSGEPDENNQGVVHDAESPLSGAHPGAEIKEPQILEEIDNSVFNEEIEEHEEQRKIDISNTADHNATEVTENGSDHAILQRIDQENLTPVYQIESPKYGDGDDDDDGDLIDYSDEENQDPVEQNPTEIGSDIRSHHGTDAASISQCLKPHPCFCPQCNELLLAEYESRNEDLRRRSVSLTVKDKVLDQTSEQASNDDNNKNEDTREDEFFDKDGDEYERYDEYEEREEEDLENGAVDSAHPNQTSESANHTDPYDDHQSSYASAGTFEDEIVEKDAGGDSHDLLATEEQVYAEEEDPVTFDNEVALGEGNGESNGSVILQTEDFSHSPHDEILGNEADESHTPLHEADSGEGTFDYGDTAESSVTADVEEIQYDEALSEEVFSDNKNITGPHVSKEYKESNEIVEQQDEIDYEDEEDDGQQENGGGHPENDLLISTDVASANGKRPRAEAESDDSMSVRNKDAKRPRS